LSPCRTRVLLAGLLLAAGPGTVAAQSAAPPEARRRCLEARRAEAAVACRLALRSGLSARAAAVVRQALVEALVEDGRFEEAVAVLREAAGLAPADPAAQLKLGAALLHLQGAAAEAVAVLQASLRLGGSDPRAYAELGLALHRLGQHPEAVAAFSEAERLEPGYFDDRPAARASFDAARRGEPWP
jgi:Flp pilus assembly protein TadD